jgi:CubicO group peptidase (beta-lactamase class C family)
MLSGVKFEDGGNGYRAAAGWNPLSGDEEADSLLGFLSTFEAEKVEPGTVFDYASVDTDLLGIALERASGKKLAELISELLSKPMGAESDALMTVDKNGTARAAGGLCATLRDVARLGQAIADGGAAAGREIVPESWINDMLHNANHEAFQKGPWAKQMPSLFGNAHYRDWWPGNQEREVLTALGLFGQMLVVDRKSNIVLAKTASQADPAEFKPVVLTIEAFREIRKVLAEESR